MVSTQSEQPKPTGPASAPSRPSATQVTASALAAVSAAVISSTFGVAGTLIGAAIASVVASVGSTLYVASMRRTNQRLRQLASAARRTDWASATAGSPTRRSIDAQIDALPDALPEDAPDELPPGVTRPALRDRLSWRELRRGLPALRRRWVAVAGLAVVAFGLAIGVIAAVEASTNQPIANIVGVHQKSGLVVNKPQKPATPTPTPTPTPTATPTPSASPSGRPSPSGTPSPTPSAAPSGGVGTTPSPTPSASVIPGLPSPSLSAPATTP